VNCFYECRSLYSVRFELGSRRSPIENEGFCETGLIEIMIPDSVTFLGKKCFSSSGSFSSVTFESGSRLSRIGGWAFHPTGFVAIVIQLLENGEEITIKPVLQKRQHAIRQNVDPDSSAVRKGRLMQKCNRYRNNDFN
jgi:hypothetical protein